MKVPNYILTAVQADAHQHHQERVDKILKQLGVDIKTWPAAEDETNIASRAKVILDRLPEHLKHKASISEIKPHAKNILQEEDEKVLNDITDGFLELSEQRLSKEEIKRSVLQWLLVRDSSSAAELKDLVCSVLPVPSNEDIISNIIKPHHVRVYSALKFKQMLDSVTSPATQSAENSCMWVPAATHKVEGKFLKHYGGVTLPITLMQRTQHAEPHADQSTFQPISTIPTLVEKILRLLSVQVQVVKPESENPLHTTVAAFAEETFSAPPGPFVPAGYIPPQTQWMMIMKILNNHHMGMGLILLLMAEIPRKKWMLPLVM